MGQVSFSMSFWKRKIAEDALFVNTHIPNIFRIRWDQGHGGLRDMKFILNFLIVTPSNQFFSLWAIQCNLSIWTPKLLPLLCTGKLPGLYSVTSLIWTPKPLPLLRTWKLPGLYSVTSLIWTPKLLPLLCTGKLP